MNPLDEFLAEYGSEKTAFDFGPMKGMASDVGHGAVQGLAATAVATGVAGVSMAASKIYDAATKSRDFKQMLAFNPDLHEHHQRDPRMFNQMFTSLRSMNPTFSSDPLVAGTYMRRMVDNPGSAGGILTDAVGSRDKFRSPMDGAVQSGMGAGAGHFTERSKPKVNDPLAALRQEHDKLKMQSAVDKFKASDKPKAEAEQDHHTRRLNSQSF